MTKTGKPDSYWNDLMHKYARGKFKFSTGQRPGAKKWRMTLKAIESCPLTPRFSFKVKEYDIFGKKIPCSCGYHQPSTSGSSLGQGTSEAQQVSEPEPGPSRTSQASVSKESLPLDCTLCGEKVLSDLFSDHLYNFHTEEQCEHCGKELSGVLALLNHIEVCHETKFSASPLSSRQAPPALPPPSQPPALPPLSSRQAASITASCTASSLLQTGCTITASCTASSLLQTGCSITASCTASSLLQTGCSITASCTASSLLQTGCTITVSCTASSLLQTGSSITASCTASSLLQTGCSPSQPPALPPLSSRQAAASQPPALPPPPQTGLLHCLLSSRQARITASCTAPLSSRQAPHHSLLHCLLSPPDRLPHSLLHCLLSPPDRLPALPPLSSRQALPALPPLSSRQAAPSQSPALPPLSSRAASSSQSLSNQPLQPLSIDKLKPPEVNWLSFLPKQFMRVIKPGDREWIAQCLYEPTGQLRQHFSDNWFYPPKPPKVATAPPEPMNYYRQRMFLWAPMRMWGILLKCPKCNSKMHHSGIYTKVREVIDLDSRYYLIGGDYPKCSKCVIVVCPWSSEILNQLDPSHRNKFPAVLTMHLALDRRVCTLLKPRTAGNSSEWSRQSMNYLVDCELHKKRSAFGQNVAVYQKPPPFCPLPLAQWFETVHANEILAHVNEMKGVITSTYGRILKMDSTKKITKKLAGDVGETATWMTNVTNEYGQVLNCVLTTGEGPRYQDAKEPEPEVIYVDRDCCNEAGLPPVLHLFRPWKSIVRLDIFHFMRRFSAGLTTEHHRLYGIFCSRLSSCIFEVDQRDLMELKEAKKCEMMMKYLDHTPSESQVMSSITSSEESRHCRKRTRGIEQTRQLIDKMLQSLWDSTDTMGLPLINHENMTKVWAVQQKHLECIQDPPGVDLYTKLDSRLQKGEKLLNVYRCARGSSSVESFHHHQCSFIPGWRSNAMHTQMYMLEGGSRWNLNRACDAVSMGGTSKTKMYDVRLMSNLNDLSRRVLGHPLLPEFFPPGRSTNERIAVEYLLHQTGRGDMQAPQHHSELGSILPDIDEDWAEDSLSPASVQATDMPHPHNECAIFSVFQQYSSLKNAVDHEGDIGAGTTSAVDKLAEYLVSLNRTITALSTAEADDIRRLYSNLLPMDKAQCKYTQKCKKRNLPGSWRTSRKRSGSAPGQQAAERLFMVHGQAAHKPDIPRISECVALKLLKEYQPARNRPKDVKGKILPLTQAIVQTYSHIKQLLEDNQLILQQTNLVLVTVNNTTVSSW
ncbi:hypothetical protein WMY93_002421 [Mugilogobius chulae]|uniref:C2H2-type domain-containing protein n=1 Tax=Mugilogobius chulae TaxID=88201 RepID=A0AAW0Q240_9GOBI